MLELNRCEICIRWGSKNVLLSWQRLKVKRRRNARTWKELVKEAQGLQIPPSPSFNVGHSRGNIKDLTYFSEGYYLYFASES